METQKLTIVDKVKEVATKSGVDFELDITEVVSLAERGKAIKSVEDENFTAVKKEMQQTRKYITEYFEGARSEFNRMSKGIIEVQKSVLAEFTPEETRLLSLEKAEKERLLKEARLEALPAKRERITASGVEFTDEEILDMDDAGFEIEYNVRLGAKLEADRIADQERRAEEQRKIDEANAEIERKKEEADRIEKARQEEREAAAEELRLSKERADREAKEATERLEREKKEAEDRRKAEDEERRLAAVREEEARKAAIVREEEERQQKIAQEKREAEAAIVREEEERQKLLADKMYKNFLEENEFNEETDLIIDRKIYRFVAEFKTE